jgi:MFS family permease
MTQQKSSLTKIVFASSLGGALEMYDFVLYAFFAPVIAKLFFSDDSLFIGLLATFGVFAAGYLMRPLGSIIFGHFGDRYGRKKGLVVSLLLMGVSTVLMGCLPTYAMIGAFAAVLLLLLRLLQGVAVGGDLPGAITFVAEMSPNNRRGEKCGWVYLGVNLGTVAASGLSALLTENLSSSQLAAWGWRIAFFTSVIVLVLGVYFRQKMQESGLFLKLQSEQQLLKVPLAKIFTGEPLKRLLIGVGVMWLIAVIISQILLYMPTFLHAYVALPLDKALADNALSLLFFSLLVPLFGYLSDFIGRKKLSIIASLLWIVLSWPVYSLLSHSHVFIGLLIIDVLSAMSIGIFPAILSELFTTDMRYTAVGVSYNISFAIFAGLTPLFLTFLLHWAHTPEIVAVNIILAALVSLIATLFMQDKTGKAL